jgi:amino acid adenylation domain-containing protein
MSLLDTVQPAADGVEAFVAPASFGQERFWMMDRMDPGKAAWSLPLTVRLRGPLHVAALRDALAELAARHESLRTVLQWMDDGLAQVILPEGALPLRVEDVDGATEEEREADARRRLAAELARPFDLERGPLVRARLYRLADDHHLFLLVLHHAVTDGWSNGVLLRELSALYGAFAQGQPSPLAEPELQYADFAEWQREKMTGALLERQLEWGRGALAGAPALLELPADRPRPPVHDGRGATEPVRISAELTGAVHALARAHGATPFMVLLAGFQSLLARWSRQEDVVIGTPVAGRTRPETRDVVGFFVNTLALRTELSGDPPFAEILRRVRETVLGAFSNQDLPFERLVDELNVPRSAAHAAVFQAMFVLQNAPDAPLPFHGLRVEGIELHGGTSPFDLRLGLVEHAGELSGGLQYATALFDRATVRGMIAQYQTLLAAACAEPSLRLSRLPLLTADEADAVLAIGIGPAAPYAAEPIHRLVAAQAARTPDSVAVASRGQSLRYAELDAQANRLAHHLLRLGVGHGETVAISMERSAALLVAMLGVWKAGAAYVPVDPAYPQDRRAWMLADSRAAVVLTDAASEGGIPATDARTVVIDRIDLSTEADTAPAVAVDADELAYVIYTSGSTGRPKGVMVPHRGVANFLATMAREPGIKPCDVLVAVTSLSFDIAALELLLPLTAGAKLVVATREEAMDTGRLARLLESEHASVMQATPATWRLLAQSGWHDARLAMLCGGEALPPDLARELLPRGRALWNLYGPTETTIWSSVQRVESADAIHLGAPVANTRLYVLDDALRPCPAGVPGELYIGGDGVVRGYLRRPSLTAERFVPDAFGAAGSRLYRTGDLVRRKADGALEFLGRTDFQVKVRGFRIELGEVEVRLAEHPDVRQAVCAVREDTPGNARLVAYVVAEDAAPAADVLRRALAERLPDHMVPSAYVVLEALPLTPNGKVDRRALPAPEAKRDLSGGFVAPGTAAETTIAGLWREVLGTERVGAEDNFFDLGGNSLSLIRLAQRLAETMGSTATAVDLFRYPTVRAQAAHLAADEAQPEPAPAPAENAERMRQGQSKLAMLRGMRR